MSKKIIINEENIIPIYQKTKSVNQTAKQLGISWNTCKRILNEYGVSTYTKANQYGECIDVECFSSIKTEEDAYWLGIMYSDGWIRSDRNEIGLGSIDKEMIERFQTYTGTANQIQIKKPDYCKGKMLPQGRVCQTSKAFYTLTFSSKKTKENLKNLGCLPKKSLILCCPTIEQVPDQLLWHFFRGYVDGDGWIQYDTHKHRYTIGFIGTQKFVEELTTRLKIQHYGKMKKQGDNGITFSFVINKKELVQKILNQMYFNSSIYLTRKHQKCQDLFGCSPI